ncbi:MAG TPA: BMC domain-containing protein [Candidatus Pelethocola excrementipullorum]|nr:BMC domain-containing protein [Candidatus Pelethocola excrementipullorum]
MEYRIIKSPSEGTKDIIKKRLGRIQEDFSLDHVDAIGMVQGRMIDMLCAADIAEKASGVEVYDLRGICPQHMVLIVMLGDTSSVENAIEQISIKLKEGTYSDYSQVDR